MPDGFAIQDGDQIDEYDASHLVDMDHGGALYILDAATCEQIAAYQPARWTVLLNPHRG